MKLIDRFVSRELIVNVLFAILVLSLVLRIGAYLFWRLSVLLNRDWSLNVEGIHQHVSNANTSDRNVGLNALGGLLGFSRAF